MSALGRPGNQARDHVSGWSALLLAAGVASSLLYVAARLLHPQDYSRRIAYRPPAAWYMHISNRLGVLLTSLGLAPRDAVTLVVSGRTSGKPRRVPLVRTGYRGEDYLVALAGESQWVRNVRAADGQAMICRRRARRIRVIEVPADKRPEIISEYLRQGAQRSGAKAAAQAARYYFGLNADPSLQEIHTVAEYYPVFRITYLDGSKDD